MTKFSDSLNCSGCLLHHICRYISLCSKSQSIYQHVNIPSGKQLKRLLRDQRTGRRAWMLVLASAMVARYTKLRCRICWYLKTSYLLIKVLQYTILCNENNQFEITHYGGPVIKSLPQTDDIARLYMMN